MTPVMIGGPPVILDYAQYLVPAGEAGGLAGEGVHEVGGQD